MADLRATWQIIAYTPDRGADATPITVRGTLVVPVGYGATALETLLNTAGAQLVKFGGVVINNLPQPPCPDTGIFTPRKLIFTLANGVSMSLPVNLRTALLSVKTAALASLGTISPVVCVKYVGETWRNLLDIFGASGKTVTVSPLDPRGFTYSRPHPYQTDSSNPVGRVIQKKIKVDSESNAAPPGVIGVQAWQSIVGIATATAAVMNCNGAIRQKHRRYIVTAMVDRGGLTRPTKIEVPVSSSVSGDIRTGGTTLAALASVACLEYRGESYDRFHKIV